MTKIVKRKKKRKVIRRFNKSFQTHESGFLYREVGAMYIFPDFPMKDCLYFTIRIGTGFSFTKRCRYGKTIRIPPTVIETLKRKGLTEELEAIVHIRKYVKERANGNPEEAPRKPKITLRKLHTSSTATRNNSKLLQKDQERPEHESKQSSDERNNNPL